MLPGPDIGSGSMEFVLIQAGTFQIGSNDAETDRAALLRGEDQLNTESRLGLLWIDLRDQSTVSWRRDPHVYVRRPPRIAAWKVGGVLVAPIGAGMLRCPVGVIVVTTRVKIGRASCRERV